MKLFEDEQTNRRFSRMQWRMLFATMIGYMLFYFMRKNFSFAMPGLQQDCGISKSMLGNFLFWGGIVYGLSKFVNGIVGDKMAPRKMLCFGLLACTLVNVAFGFAPQIAALFGYDALGGADAAMPLVWTFGLLLVLNQFFQGTGFPPCAKLIAFWIPPNELATKMSVWNTSHSIGAALVFALCGWFIMPHLGVDMSADSETVAAIASNLGLKITDPEVLSFAAHYCAWRWCFIIPAIFAICGAVWLFLSMKDSPSDVGFQEIMGKKKTLVRTAEENAEYKLFVRRKVFRNKLIWILAVTNFFVYIVRFAALDWGPTLLTESKGLSLATATTLCIVFEFVGGNIGMLAAGWATDHIFRNKAHHTCFFCMLGAALSIALFWIIPEGASWWLMILPFTFIGFFIYGPQALLGIAAANQATNKASATANGILGVFGYASTLISGVGFGFVAQHYGWNVAYVTMIVMALAGALSLLMMWNAKADGYDEN